MEDLDARTRTRERFARLLRSLRRIARSCPDRVTAVCHAYGFIYMTLDLRFGEKGREHSFGDLVTRVEEDVRVFEGKADLVRRLRTLDAWMQGGYDAGKGEAEHHTRTCVHLYRRVLHIPF